MSADSDGNEVVTAPSLEIGDAHVPEVETRAPRKRRRTATATANGDTTPSGDNEAAPRRARRRRSTTQDADQPSVASLSAGSEVATASEQAAPTPRARKTRKATDSSSASEAPTVVAEPVSSGAEESQSAPRQRRSRAKAIAEEAAATAPRPRARRSRAAAANGAATGLGDSLEDVPAVVSDEQPAVPEPPVTGQVLEEPPTAPPVEAPAKRRGRPPGSKTRRSDEENGAGAIPVQAQEPPARKRRASRRTADVTSAPSITGAEEVLAPIASLSPVAVATTPATALPDDPSFRQLVRLWPELHPQARRALVLFAATLHVEGVTEAS